MKRITLVFFLLLPFCSRAQGTFLGKSKDEINAYFKSFGVPILRNKVNALYGLLFSDCYASNNNEQICFGYNENKICVEIIESMKLSLIDSLRNNFNDIYIKRSGETFSTDVWADKKNTFKVHLEAVKLIGIVYLDYLPVDKPYVIH